MRQLKSAKCEALTRYWMLWYSKDGCSLCEKDGIIDTTGATPSRGQNVGRRNFCICPTGQAMRHHHKSIEAYDAKQKVTIASRSGGTAGY
jgi:hypothetical protein